MNLLVHACETLNDGIANNLYAQALLDDNPTDLASRDTPRRSLSVVYRTLPQSLPLSNGSSPGCSWWYLDGIWDGEEWQIPFLFFSHVDCDSGFSGMWSIGM
jgi:hypothetical protein